MNRFQIACLVFLIIPFTISGQSVIINEISQGSDGGKEWVELLVVSDGVNLKGWELGDNDDGNWHPITLFKYIDAWSSVSSGTIIVLYNGGDVDSAIIARGGEDTDFSDGSVMFPIGSSTYFADIGPWGLTGGAFSNSDTDDCPALRNSEGEIIHDMAITHPTATVQSPGIGKAKQYTGNTTAGLSDDSQWTVVTSSAGTPGETNGGDNSSWVDQSLPVELSQWFATSVQEHVILSWVTESEFENQGFIIERRQKGQTASDRPWAEISSFTTNPDLQGQGSTTAHTEYAFIDKQVAVGETYDYRLSDVDYRGGVTTHAEISVTVRDAVSDPKLAQFTIHKAYPNPFNPEVHLSFTLNDPSNALSLEIYNLRGVLVQSLAAGYHPKGSYDFTWNGISSTGHQATSGVYLVRLESNTHVQFKRITLLR